jgi:hypothetical protein
MECPMPIGNCDGSCDRCVYRDEQPVQSVSQALTDAQIDAGAKALWNRGRAGFWEEAPTSAREHYRIEAREVLEAALHTPVAQTQASSCACGLDPTLCVKDEMACGPAEPDGARNVPAAEIREGVDR